MIVEQFLIWVQTAKAGDRAAAAAALARAYVNGDLAIDDRCAADAAMTLLLDDPSAKVRMALAEALSMSRTAPPQIISALAADQPDVASIVLARSPILTDNDLIDRVAIGHKATQRLIADRVSVSMGVSAALSEVGDEEACLVLLQNPGAQIAGLSFKRITERFGDVACIREALVCDRRLPSECRHTLMAKLGNALQQSPLMLALFGEARAGRLTKDACVKASLCLIDSTDTSEFPALVEHMRVRGDLTSSYIVRAVAHGKIDFFGAAMVSLSGLGDNRVRALLSNGYDSALAALFSKAGLTPRTHGVILKALKIWREVARGKRVAGAQEVSWLMLKELGTEETDLSALLKSIHLDALRTNARHHALALTAATIEAYNAAEEEARLAVEAAAEEEARLAFEAAAEEMLLEDFHDPDIEEFSAHRQAVAA